MASSSSHAQTGRQTRLQEATEKRRASDQLKEQMEMKRAKKMFAPRKLIGPRDILVNTCLPKVKLEEDIVSSVKQEVVEELSPNSDDLGESDVFIQTGPLNTEMSVDHNVVIAETRPDENLSENENDLECNQFIQNHIKLLETLVNQKDQEINVLNELIKGLQQHSSNDKEQIGLDDPNNKFGLMQLVTKHTSDLSDRDAEIRRLSSEMEKLQDDTFGNTNEKLVQDSFKKVLPLLYPQLNLNDLLSCRRVCRDWSCATDIFLNTHPSLLPFDKESHLKDMRKLEFGNIPTWKESPIQKLTKAYKFLRLRDLKFFTHNSKFQIVGSTVCWDNILLRKSFRIELVTRFFTTFSSRISYLKIRQSVLSGSFRLDDLMDRVKLCFAELPNLKGFTLVFWVDAHKIRNENGWDALQKLGKRDYENWHSIFFPKLENLESLTIEMENYERLGNDGSFLCNFNKSLVHPYIRKLKQLSIFAHHHQGEYSLDAPNLVQLTIPLMYFGLLVKFRCENVQKCTLTDCGLYLAQTDLAKIKERFPQLTCLGLKFEIGNACIYKYRRHTETTTLPSVQTPELVNCGAVTFPILCRFPNLRYINIVIKKIKTGEDYDGDATLHITKLWKGANLYENKLFWEQFPNIYVVSLNFCGDPKTSMGQKLFTWTRQCYLRY